MCKTSKLLRFLPPSDTKFQKPGDHPNFRKHALGVRRRPLSELSESSGKFSEQLLGFRK